MSKQSIFALTIVGLCFVAPACGGNGVSLGNDGGQSGGGSSGSSAGSGGSGAVTSGGATTGGLSAGGASAGRGGTATAGAAGSGGTGGGPNQACLNPTARDGGWEECDNGVLHRPKPGTCGFTPSDATLPPSQGGQDQCNKDADCTAKPNGYCVSVGDFNLPNNLCHYACLNDADCGANGVCVCSRAGSRQVGICMESSSCKSDEDCQGGALCTDYPSQPGCPSRKFACQTPQDECQSDQDCPTSVLPICGYEDGHRKCTAIVCQADIRSP